MNPIEQPQLSLWVSEQHTTRLYLTFIQSSKKFGVYRKVSLKSTNEANKFYSTRATFNHVSYPAQNEVDCVDRELHSVIAA